MKKVALVAAAFLRGAVAAHEAVLQAGPAACGAARRSEAKHEPQHERYEEHAADTQAND